MENPLHEYILIREIELNSNGSPIYPRHDEHKQLILENDARPPLAVYFGRTLGGKRDWRTGGRVERYNLKKRVYLGPTSMDNELSFIMTNLAKVNVGSFVFDPFAGTGMFIISFSIHMQYLIMPFCSHNIYSTISCH
jgi:tRNA (guanine10-N2)-methyltransferase